MLNIISLIPHFLTIGEDIIKCIEGGTTQEEWNKTVDDFYNMAKDIPQVQGVLAIIELVSITTKVSFPILDRYLLSDTDENKPKLKSAKKKVAKSLDTEDMLKAQRSMKFFNEVLDKIALDNNVERKPIDTSWTKTFFDDMNNP